MCLHNLVLPAWDHDAERQAVPRSGRGCRRTAASKLLQQSQCVHSQARSCCSDSCTKSTSYGINLIFSKLPILCYYRGLNLSLKHSAFFLSESVPAFCSCPTAASYAVGFYPTSCSNQHRAWSATFFSCAAAQCDPPCHEAFIPPTSCSCSRFGRLVFYFQVFEADFI